MYGVSGGLLLSALAAPNLLKPVYKVWMKIAHAIGWFNTRVLLTLIYYVIFTPIGLLARAIGKDLLNTKLEPEATTYWIPREKKEVPPEDYERQF